MKHMVTKRALIPMFDGAGRPAPFDLIVYGRNRSDLMTIPNDVTPRLAEKFPDHASSIFHVQDFRGYRR